MWGGIEWRLPSKYQHLVQEIWSWGWDRHLQCSHFKSRQIKSWIQTRKEWFSDRKKDCKKNNEYPLRRFPVGRWIVFLYPPKRKVICHGYFYLHLNLYFKIYGRLYNLIYCWYTFRLRALLDEILYSCKNYRPKYVYKIKEVGNNRSFFWCLL